MPKPTEPQFETKTVRDLDLTLLGGTVIQLTLGAGDSVMVDDRTILVTIPAKAEVITVERRNLLLWSLRGPFERQYLVPDIPPAR